VLDLAVLAASLAALAALVACLCRWHRRAVPAAVPVGAALLLSLAAALYQPRRMEETHMKQTTKARAAVKPRAAGASPLFVPPSEPLAQRAWLAVAEEIGPPPAPGMLPVQAFVCEGVRTPPRWEGK
jgi:hypothetical protein